MARYIQIKDLQALFLIGKTPTCRAPKPCEKNKQTIVFICKNWKPTNNSLLFHVVLRFCCLNSRRGRSDPQRFFVEEAHKEDDKATEPWGDRSELPVDLGGLPQETHELYLVLLKMIVFFGFLNSLIVFYWVYIIYFIVFFSVFGLLLC